MIRLHNIPPLSFSEIMHATVGSINFDDYNLMNCYGRLKANNQGQLAKVLMIQELAQRLPSIKFYAVHPGFVQTNIGQFIYSDYFHNLSPIVRVTRGMQRVFFKSSLEGAQTVIHCAVDPHADQQSGLYYE